MLGGITNSTPFIPFKYATVCALAVLYDLQKLTYIELYLNLILYSSTYLAILYSYSLLEDTEMHDPPPSPSL